MHDDNRDHLPAEATTPVPAITNQAPAGSLFSTGEAFEHAQRCARLLQASTLLPPGFKNSLADTVLLLEISNRLGVSPFVAAQNLTFIHGKPCWSAQFVIALLNGCGRFSPLKFRMEGEGDGLTCTAYATELGTGEEIEGPPVSVEMARREGWFSRAGSKWPTLTRLMLTYRAGTFFARVHAPGLLLGLRTADEVGDIGATGQGNQAAAVEALLVDEVDQ